MESNENINSQYQKCSGRKCNNQAPYYMNIRHINRSGWFCHSCKRDLEINGLANSERGSKNEHVEVL